MRDARFLAGGLRMLLAVVMLEGLARPAAAQVFELGGGVSRGCTGDSSGFCGDQTGPLWALHGGIWLSPQWQISLRLAILPLPDFGYSTPRDERFNRATDPALRVVPRIDITTRENSRRLAGGEAIYYFARAGRLGAVLGVGIGQVRNRSTSSCEPAGCEDLMRVLGDGAGRRGSRGSRNLTFIAGLSGRAWTRVQMSGGVRLHNFAGESLSTAEAFLTTGVRFGSF